MDSAIFAYGTLKSGFRNHDLYCRGVQSVHPAAVWGRLYRLDAGFPMLVIPPETALAWGGIDRAHDAALVSTLALRSDWRCAERPVGDWELIQGERLVFDDLSVRFADLDELEDFLPNAAGYYDRAIVWTVGSDPQPAWVYVAPAGRLPPGAARCGACWT